MGMPLSIMDVKEIMISCRISSSLNSMPPSSARSWPRCEIRPKTPSGPTFVKDPNGGAAAWDALPFSGKTDLGCMTPHQPLGCAMRCWYTARSMGEGLYSRRHDGCADWEVSSAWASGHC